MAKVFTGVVSIIFIAVGVATIFLPFLEIHTYQAEAYIVVGLVGLLAWWRTGGERFTSILSVSCLILAALGFMGLRNVLGLVEFHELSKWPYFVLGLCSLWVALSSRTEKTKFVNNTNL